MWSNEQVVLAVLVAFHFGAVAKTIIDGCYYHRGVLHGWRVSNGDVDIDLTDAQEIISRSENN